MPASCRHGFTLIELSIVLVIIGLIVSGILVGRDLIRAAELRADISGVEKFGQAINAFRLKYNCLPGDCANATQFLEGAYNGNGDGHITSTETAPGSGLFVSEGTFIGTELAYAIDDLARANLIAVAPFEANDPGVTVHTDKALPKLPRAEGFVVLAECRWIEAPAHCRLSSKHIYRLGVKDYGDWIAGYVKTAPGTYTPEDAFYVDTKIDDGKAVSGNVLAGNNTDVTLAFVSIALMGGTPCDNSGITWVGLKVDCEYDLSVTERWVGLIVRGSF